MLLLLIERRNHGPSSWGSPARHARPDCSANPSRHRPAARYGIAQRVQQVSEDLLKLNQGTLYPALLRLEQRGWISSKWGASENNRKAKFYTVTRAGRKQLLAETESWERMTALMARLLGTTEGV